MIRDWLWRSSESAISPAFVEPELLVTDGMPPVEVPADHRSYTEVPHGTRSPARALAPRRRYVDATARSRVLTATERVPLRCGKPSTPIAHYSDATQKRRKPRRSGISVERMTRFELATSTLAR